MENQAIVTPIQESTAPAKSSDQLRDEWAMLNERTQSAIRGIAEQFLFGHWADGKPIMRKHEGVYRHITLAELIQEDESGWIDRASPITLAHAERIVAWLDRKRRKERWNVFRDAIGPRHAESTIGNFKATTPEQISVLAAVKDYAQHGNERVKAGVGIIANGPVGTGKTHLLIGLARGAIRDGFTVEYRNGQRLLSGFRSRIGDDHGPSEEEMLDDLVRPDVLILDDPIPPHGELTSYQEQLLYIVADGRYNAMKPTWVSMNVASTEEAQARLGAAILDRWKHNALTLAFNWPSRRQAGEFDSMNAQEAHRAMIQPDDLEHVEGGLRAADAKLER